MASPELEQALSMMESLEVFLRAATATVCEEIKASRAFIVAAQSPAKPSRVAKAKPVTTAPERHQPTTSSPLRLLDGNPKARPQLMRSYDFGVIDGGGGRPAA